MLLSRGDKKKKAIAAASAVKARGGFDKSYAYTPAMLCDERVFVIDDAQLIGESDESGRLFLFTELLFDAYILYCMPENPEGHEHELLEKAVDEMVSDLADQLPIEGMRLVLPVSFTVRKVPTGDERNPAFRQYATAEFKIR